MSSILPKEVYLRERFSIERIQRIGFDYDVFQVSLDNGNKIIEVQICDSEEIYNEIHKLPSVVEYISGSYVLIGHVMWYVVFSIDIDSTTSLPEIQSSSMLESLLTYPKDSETRPSFVEHYQKTLSKNENINRI